MSMLKCYERDECVITLIGYMRIIDEDICNMLTIYNLHPGDIVEHPFLKGKDPIEKYIKYYKSNNITGNITIGSVIHKVTPEVDSGEIVLRKTCSTTIEDVYESSFNLNVSMWCHLLPQLLS